MNTEYLPTVMKTNASIFTLLITILFSVSLSAAETITPKSAVASFPATISSSVEILEPEFYEWGIEYTTSWQRADMQNQTIIGHLVEIIDKPTLKVDGPFTFTDGTIAPLTYAFTFTGIWYLHGNATFEDMPDKVAFGELYTTRKVTLTFGLTEDAEKGLCWRIISGSLPSGSIGHPMSPDSGLLLTGNFTFTFDHTNDLDYHLHSAHDQFPEIFYHDQYQTLNASRCTSEYPCFVFIGHRKHNSFHEGYEDLSVWTFSMTLNSGIHESSDPQ